MVMDEDRELLKFPAQTIAPGQEIIQTKNVDESFTYIQELTALQGYESKLGAIFGEAGKGKTIIALNAIQKYQRLSHTGYREIVYFEIRPDPTPRLLLGDILRYFEEDPDGTHASQWADQVKKVFEENFIHLLILDEGSYVNRAILNILRFLYGKTGISILLLGTLETHQTIRRDPQFLTRLYQPMMIADMQEDEILNVYLPKISLKHWKFDPKDKEDKLMGTILFNRVRANLRFLKDILESADKTALLMNREKIDIEVLNIVLESMTLQGKSKKTANDNIFDPELSPEELASLQKKHRNSKK